MCACVYKVSEKIRLKIKTIQDSPKSQKFSSDFDLQLVFLKHTFFDCYMKTKFGLPEFSMLELPTFDQN